jgi:hypothetical protein
MAGEDELLAEAEQILRDTLEVEELAEVLRMHDAVGRLLSALEARIEELVPGWKDWQ